MGKGASSKRKRPSRLIKCYNFALAEWNDVRGNAKWSAAQTVATLALSTLWGFIVFLRNGPSWQIYGSFASLTAGLLIFIFWKSKFAKFLSVFLIIMGLLASAVFAGIYAYGAVKSESLTQAIFNNSNSPKIEASPGATLNAPTFQNQGAANYQIGNGNQIINNYNFYPAVKTQIFDIKSTYTNSGPEWLTFTNESEIAASSFEKNDITNAYFHTVKAIQIAESSGFKQTNSPRLEEIKSGLYLMAAVSLDDMKGDPKLIYEYIKKGFALETREPWRSSVAMYAHNYAIHAFFNKDFEKTLDLEREAIKIYQENPSWINQYTPSNSAVKFYQYAIDASFYLGMPDIAAKYTSEKFKLFPPEFLHHSIVTKP